MPTWLAIVVAIVSVFVGLIALGAWLRRIFETRVTSVVSQPLSNITTHLDNQDRNISDLQRSTTRLHERVDRIQETVRDVRNHQ